MSIAPDYATFGAGGTEPYARALRGDSESALYLHELHDGDRPKTAEIDIAKFSANADAVDLRLLASVLGPVLDVGCGPGRMVRAAMELGLEALGIDVSPAAIEIATESRLAVLQRSVFDTLPLEGRWQTVLLVDGNIGIGGDVDALLRRCRQLLSATGEIVIELHPDRFRDRTFTGRLVDNAGGSSASFPWAEIGLEKLAERSVPMGLGVRQAWTEGDRSFCRLANILR